MSNQSETNVLEKIDMKLPNLYNVIFFNDDITPIGFVLQVLIDVFGHSKESAAKIIVNIESNGSGVVGTYIKSIAEAKVILVRECAIKANYPLTVTMEKEG